MNQMLAKPIKLADQVIRYAELATAFKKSLNELKLHTQEIAKLLRQTLTSEESSIYYKRPINQVIGETEQVLDKALSLVLKCHRDGDGLMKLVSVKIPADDFIQISRQLQNSISDLILLLHLFIVPNYEMLHMDSIYCILSAQRLYLSAIESLDHGLDRPYEKFVEFTHKQVLSLLSDDGDPRWIIWFLIAKFYDSSQQEYGLFWALSLLFLSQRSNQLKKLIINGGGVVPLLKLLQEGRRIKDQEIAAKVIGTLAHDSESVENIIDAGVYLVFVKILKEGCMKVQAEVVWAVSEFTANYPKCQDMFSQSNVTRLLIDHLAFEMVEDDVHNAIVINKATSVLAIVMARNHLDMSKAIEEYDNEKQNPSQTDHEQNRKFENPETKSRMKAMAARALGHLAKGNSSVSRSITQSRALMCLVELLDKGGSKDVQCNSAVALMEITAVAEKDPDLRRFAFKPSSPLWKAIIGQLIKILGRENDFEILKPCIKTIGNLANTFRVVETKIIYPLVQYLKRIDEVSMEVLEALTKFACTDNYLHLDNSKAILTSGGAKRLVEHVQQYGNQFRQLSALLILCYIVLDVPEDDGLMEAKVLTVLEQASKQPNMTQDETLRSLLPKAKSRLELYQSRGLRGSYS